MFQPSAAWTAALSQTVQHAALTVSAFVTSTDATGRLGASAVSVAKVTGSTGNILVTRYFAERPDQCFRDLEDAGSPGLSTYYCVVIQNTSATSETNPIAPLTTHELTDSATGGRVIIPNVTILSTERLTVTNQFLADRGLPQILGPVRYPQSGVFVSTSIVTSTNPTFGYRTSATSNSTHSHHQHTAAGHTDAHQHTAADLDAAAHLDADPVPADVDSGADLDAGADLTPSPTVVIITTPGGFPPTAYPQIGPGGLATLTPDPFAPPGVLDPVAQTATVDLWLRHALAARWRRSSLPRLQPQPCYLASSHPPIPLRRLLRPRRSSAPHRPIPLPRLLRLKRFSACRLPIPLRRLPRLKRFSACRRPILLRRLPPRRRFSACRPPILLRRLPPRRRFSAPIRRWRPRRLEWWPYCHHPAL